MMPVLNVDVVITGSEVNNRHGTGIFVKSIFKDDSQIVSIRSSDGYGGEQDFGLKSFRYNQDEGGLLAKLEGISVRRILCIPYNPDDANTAITLKNYFQVPLCTYLMDDRNILLDGISDQLMTELLENSELRLAISPEMRDFYSAKYSCEITFVPPLVDENLCNKSFEIEGVLQKEQGILIGNIWSRKAFQKLYETVNQSKQKIHWYGQGSAEALAHVSQVNISNSSDSRQGAITSLGFLPTQHDVIKALNQYKFAIIPSGCLDDDDDRPEISQFSLPSRIPFIVATSQVPIIVMGSTRTAAARFVTQLNLGLVCDYNPKEFDCAVEHICTPSINKAMRKNAKEIANLFYINGFEEWLWNSLEKGTPLTSAFDKLSAMLERNDVLPTLFFHAKSKHKAYAEIEKLNQELIVTRKIIDSMKTSKFWQLRKRWLKLRQKLGIPGDDPNSPIL